MDNYCPLLTDQYQFVMAYGYWSLGMAEQEAVFHLSFRRLPNHSSYILFAGLQRIIDFLHNFKLSESDIDFLARQQNGKGQLFPNEFLDYLKNLRFSCHLDVVPEGTILFAKETVLRIQGPILQCQLLETPLLNILNFSSLIATKASNVYIAAKGGPVIEFGLRRAQGPDGALTASRSAYIGGCCGTSNVLAGKLYSIPIYGTQAHSWIMAFPSELEAFSKFAQVMRSNTSLLVDTYETIQGVKHAITVGQALKAKGERLAAIRLDSGNLLTLSRKARRLLDKAGLTETQIMASGDLDEHVIRKLKENDAPIDLWGVGTKLVTAYDQPALNAIYKLSALQDANGTWNYKMKISDDINKSTLPGIPQITRYYKNAIPVQDVIWDIELGEDYLEEFDSNEKLLKTIFVRGKLVYPTIALDEIRKQAMKNLHDYIKFSPKPYPVVISKKLQNKIDALLVQIEQQNLVS